LGQSDEAKKGEIKFRKVICEQQINGKLIHEDEFDRENIEKILMERMKKTYHQFLNLKNDGVVISPYLEIGAERGQRSLVLENDLAAKGIAADLSYFSLKGCEYYRSKFNKLKSPKLLCCDVYSLPIRSNSISFVFCYQTLHHFPDPTQILKNIYKVLSPGGAFFFDEEPFKQKLHFSIYSRDKIYSKKELNKSKFVRYMDYFFGKKTCNEREYGVIENEDIALKTWRQALSIFNTKNVTLQFSRVSITDFFNSKNYIKLFLLDLLGGSISGICYKKGNFNAAKIPLDELFICPDCLKNDLESSLCREEGCFRCINCGKKYPIIDNIYFILPHEEFKKLYPEFV
jgi:ubiquinone/menaquinone biosynthesis C-methylase UbiE/uncharacterized protein YbaR (Trm112 family)